MHVADSGIISNDSFTVESRAPPTGHRACYLSGCVQQALPRKEYPVGKQLRGPLQKQLGVVYGLTPPFSQLWGCLHPLAQKTGLLTLKNTHVMNEECKQSLVLDRAFKVVAELSGCVITFTIRFSGGPDLLGSGARSLFIRHQECRVSSINTGAANKSGHFQGHFEEGGGRESKTKTPHRRRTSTS